MTDEEINEVLATIISNYGITPSVAKAAKIVSKKQRMFHIERRLEGIAGDSFPQLKKIFLSCGIVGAVLTEDTEERVLEVIVMAGVAGMNPAFVRLWQEEDALCIRAYAKEGLIKQHTAERAIGMLEEALKRSGMV